MKQIFILLFSFFTLAVSAQTAERKVIFNDPANYRALSSVHAGAGTMGFTQLVGRNDLNANFLYLHAGVIDPKGGIGHHFHHTIEEMYVILDGEAEFTINGRTAVVQGPAVVPCKLGDAHAVYNHTDKPLKWLNYAVSNTKGQSDNFDLGDTRVGATIDKVPTFVYGQMKKELLGTRGNPYTGEGVLYRRILGPAVFKTSWNHVDHVLIPAGKTAGPRQLQGIEEVYYVMNGSGTYTAGKFTSAFKKDDTFTGLVGETVTFTNTGTEDIEMLVIGVSVAKNKFAPAVAAPAKPKAMVLQMDFVVAQENAEAFEKMYTSIYVPAMTVQQGYIESKLLRIYPEESSKRIGAEATDHNYQIQLSYDTEENRMKWVRSAQHNIAWPAAIALAKSYKWKGYDVIGDDWKE